MVNMDRVKGYQAGQVTKRKLQTSRPEVMILNLGSDGVKEGAGSLSYILHIILFIDLLLLSFVTVKVSFGPSF